MGSCPTGCWSRADMTRAAAALVAAVAVATAASAEEADDVDPLPVLTYAAPEGAEPATVIDHRVSEWEPGTTIHATEPLSVRERPAAGARIVAHVPAGAALEVRARDAALVAVGGLVNHHYQVAMGATSGWVHGSLLTPFAFTSDLDGDGADEMATIDFSADYRIRVRVWDRDTEPSETSVVAAGQAYLGLRGGNASAALEAATLAGIPLIRLESRPEACSDYLTAYVSYVPDHAGNVAARVALELPGLADPPVHASSTPQFDAARRRVRVTSVSEEEDDEGNVSREQSVTLYSLVDGVFVEP